MMEWCERIGVGYGSTEIVGFATFSLPDESSEKFIEGYVGVPFEGVEVLVVDGN